MLSEGYCIRPGQSGCGKKVSVWTLMAYKSDPSSVHLAAYSGASSTENLGLLFCKTGVGLSGMRQGCGRQWEHSRHSLNLKAQTTEPQRSMLLRLALLSAASSQA